MDKYLVIGHRDGPLSMTYRSRSVSKAVNTGLFYTVYTLLHDFEHVEVPYDIDTHDTWDVWRFRGVI